MPKVARIPLIGLVKTPGRRLWPADRKGVFGLALGVGSALLLGFVGVATEGGSWYAARQNAQSAADTAAFAGAMRVGYTANALALPLATQQSQAQAAARNTATRNGFTHGAAGARVFVNTPPLTGAFAGSNGAVEVIIERDQTRVLSRLVFASDTQLIRARGVAAIQDLGPACLVGGIGQPTPAQGVVAGGNSNVQLPNCIAASNSTGPTAIERFGSAILNALQLVSVGGCAGCSGDVRTGALPSTNPFEYLDSKALPSFTNADCVNQNGTVLPRNGVVNSTVTINPPPTGKAICALSISGAGTTVTLTPGIYYFHNTDFSVQSGTVVCAGCTPGNGITMVFTGNNAGGPDITGGTVTLVGGSAADPDYAGILFFRDPDAPPGNQGNPAADIGGNGDVHLTGGMYFPNAYVNYRGTPSANQCSVLAAGTIRLTGTSGLETTGCAGLGFDDLVPMLQVVRLME